MKNKTSAEKAVTAKDVQIETAAAQPAASPEAGQNITGRAVFAVDTAAAGIVVRTAFLTEQGQLVDMPAVFPDLSYALNQIDHLRQLVLERFAQAAQVGVQVIAASAAQQGAAATGQAPAAQAAEASSGEPVNA